jgi:uncharacterized protein
MNLPVTAFTAAIIAIMLLILAIDTVRHRVRAQAAFGDAGDAKLISASRAHGNLAEHAPIVLIMMACLELVHAYHPLLMGLGALFLAGRIAHIVGLYAPVSTKPPLPRSIGVIVTWVVIAALSGWTLWLLAISN